MLYFVRMRTVLTQRCCCGRSGRGWRRSAEYCACWCALRKKIEPGASRSISSANRGLGIDSNRWDR